MRDKIRFLLRNWLQDFKPDLIVDSVTGIDFETLRRKGIKGIIWDLDNTLLGKGDMEVDPQTAQRILSANFHSTIVSNTIWLTEKRFQRLQAAQIATNALSVIALGAGEKKPHPGGIIDSIHGMGLLPEEVAVIGDLLATDIRAAHRARKVLGSTGPLAIWIRIPLGKQSLHMRYFRRPFDRLIAWILEL